MADYVYSRKPTDGNVSWSDPTIWSGGVVPDGANADVTLLGNGSNPYTVTIAADEYFEAATLDVNDQILQLDGQLSVYGALSVQAGGQVSMDEGTLYADGGATLDGSSGIGGSGTIVGPVVDNGTIDVLPGSDNQSELYIDGPVTGDGVLVVGNNSTTVNQDNVLELGGPVSANVQFGAYLSVVLLDDPEDFTGTITPTVKPYGGSTSSTVDDYVLLAGLSYGDVTTFTYGGASIGGVVTLAGDGKTVTLNVAGDFSDDDFVITAGPELNDGESSLFLSVTPELAAPTAGLALPGGETTSVAIINTSDPTVTGIIPAGADIYLTADGGIPESAPIEIVYDENPPPDVSRAYSDTLTKALTAGPHEIEADAVGAGGSADSDPLYLLVLPDPVNGITTAAVSSFQFASYLDRGASMQFVAGTEAIQLTDGTLSVGADTVQASVQRLYEGLLGRAGDTGGLE